MIAGAAVRPRLPSVITDHAEPDIRAPVPRGSGWITKSHHDVARVAHEFRRFRLMSPRRLRSAWVSASALSVSNLSRSRLEFTSFIRPPGRCDRFPLAARVPRDRLGDKSIATRGELNTGSGVARPYLEIDER